MTPINPNDPAFPCEIKLVQFTSDGKFTYPGIPIRLHIAAMAMQGILSSLDLDRAPDVDDVKFDNLASTSLAAADELIKQYNQSSEVKT